MTINDKYYSETVSYLVKFIDIQRHKKVEDGSYLIQTKNTWYMLSDNGGETNVELINGKSISIPHTSNKQKITPLVLAYRIAAYLQDGWGNVDWNVNENIIKTAIVEYKSNNIEVINYIAKEVM